MMRPSFLFGDEMDIAKDFDDYMAYLTQGLGHTDRHVGLIGYCTGAARVEPDQHLKIGLLFGSLNHSLRRGISPDSNEVV
jgi:hypothetical protein